MLARVLKIVISVIVSLLLLWLAFKSVDIAELWQEIRKVSLLWLVPFTLVVGISHYCRAERWRMLINGVERIPPRTTLFAGVMMGYILNYVFPRLGEITRPVYVARQSQISSGNLFGTIVLERLIDLFCMSLFLVYIVVYLLSDSDAITRIFGTDPFNGPFWAILALLLIGLAAIVWCVHRWVNHPETLKNVTNPFLVKIIGWIRRFLEGLNAVKRVKSWPRFIFLTLVIWGGYVLMTWLPFWMLDLHTTYDLGLLDAVIITVISAAGMTMPTPGGIGSYHLFVQQSLWVLYGVPLVSGLTYATVTHVANLVIVVLIGVGTLWVDKYYTLKVTGNADL